MKFFVEPAIEIEKFELVDVITTSNEDPTNPTESTIPGEYEIGNEAFPE